MPSVTTAENRAGLGSRAKGGTWASTGHLYAFGNTEEKYHLKVFGIRGVGREGDKPFDHTTGEGWIATRRGDYHDALHVKHNIVRLLLVEASGGVAPMGRRAIRALHQRARLKGAHDGTRYSRLRIAPQSFARHHTQRLVLAACRGDGEAIVKHAAALKSRAAALDSAA